MMQPDSFVEYSNHAPSLGPRGKRAGQENNASAATGTEPGVGSRITAYFAHRANSRRINYPTSSRCVSHDNT